MEDRLPTPKFRFFFFCPLQNLESSTSLRSVEITQILNVFPAALAARKSLCGYLCSISTNMWFFIHSPRDYGLPALARQPGVCRYGTKMACCYGWKRNSKGVCEGNCLQKLKPPGDWVSFQSVTLTPKDYQSPIWNGWHYHA